MSFLREVLYAFVSFISIPNQRMVVDYLKLIKMMFKIQLISHINTHCFSITKTNYLILIREIISVVMGIVQSTQIRHVAKIHSSEL